MNRDDGFWWDIAFAAIALVLFLYAATTPVLALEKDAQIPWCAEAGGEAEVVLPDKTRIDCVTKSHAIEFDFAYKWAEAVGQSLWYAANTGRRAAIVLIVKSEKDQKYVDRIRALVAHYGLPVDIWTTSEVGKP